MCHFVFLLFLYVGGGDPEYIYIYIHMITSLCIHRRPDAKSAKNPASPHSTQISKNIEVRRCRVSVLNKTHLLL